MFQSLKIALRSPKKLIAVFLLTIFIPSVSLSIFGVIALRNEKFRLVKQIENEQIRLIEDIKSRINTKFIEIGNRIESLTTNPSFQNKDYIKIKNLLLNQFENEPLVDQVFLLYSNEEPYFPQFQNRFANMSESAKTDPDTFQLNKIRLAEDLEFRQKKYYDAISNYYELYNYSKHKIAKARALNCIARNYIKLSDFRNALEINLKNINEFPEIFRESDLPVILYAKLQTVECYQKLDEPEEAVNTALNFYRELLSNRWDLSEDRFHTFVGLTTEAINKLFEKETALQSKYSNDLLELEKEYHSKTAEWKNANLLQSIVITDLKEYIQGNLSQPSVFRKLETVDEQDFLIIGAGFTETASENQLGILGVSLNKKSLENELLLIATNNIRSLKNTTFCISNLSGRVIAGEKNEEPELIKTTAFWDDKFPPWQIELSSPDSDRIGTGGILSNFFFWTIITLIFILVFGSILIVRIIHTEMELLSLKSDFVSSVSHEFKTPLTSMKALTERMERGKVIQPEKLRQYLSVISFDIERLIRLVGNILNFAKTEEGKKVYRMEKTDTGLWLKQLISNFNKENFENSISVQVQIADVLPVISMDKDAMTQAIYNLLDNAVKFSPGKKEIGVTAEKSDNTVLIKIKDKGIGIEKDESAKIFEKFYRGKKAIENSIRGTGLGLTLVKFTIEAHGGTIKTITESGWNSVFAVFLPI